MYRLIDQLKSLTIDDRRLFNYYVYRLRNNDQIYILSHGSKTKLYWLTTTTCRNSPLECYNCHQTIREKEGYCFGCKSYNTKVYGNNIGIPCGTIQEAEFYLFYRNTRQKKQKKLVVVQRRKNCTTISEFRPCRKIGFGLTYPSLQRFLKWCRYYYIINAIQHFDLDCDVRGIIMKLLIQLDSKK